MFRRPAHRLATTLLVVFALLFSQLALASFVCNFGSSGLAQASSMAADMAMAPAEPCDGMGMKMDLGQPVLCHQHCVDAPQSFDPVHVPAVSLPAVVHVVILPALLDAGADDAAVHADTGPARPPPGSLFLHTLRLRV